MNDREVAKLTFGVSISFQHMTVFGTNIELRSMVFLRRLPQGLRVDIHPLTPRKRRWNGEFAQN